MLKSCLHAANPAWCAPASSGPPVPASACRPAREWSRPPPAATCPRKGSGAPPARPPRDGPAARWRRLARRASHKPDTRGNTHSPRAAGGRPGRCPEGGCLSPSSSSPPCIPLLKSATRGPRRGSSRARARGPHRHRRRRLRHRDSHSTIAGLGNERHHRARRGTPCPSGRINAAAAHADY